MPPLVRRRGGILILGGKKAKLQLKNTCRKPSVQRHGQTARPGAGKIRARRPLESVFGVQFTKRSWRPVREGIHNNKLTAGGRFKVSRTWVHGKHVSLCSYLSVSPREKERQGEKWVCLEGVLFGGRGGGNVAVIKKSHDGARSSGGWALAGGRKAVNSRREGIRR